MVSDSPLAVGVNAPEFSTQLVSPEGSTEETSLRSLLDEAPVLLPFYTNDFSPDCIEEWCSFRDYNWFTADDRFNLVGISKSRPATHRQFINRLELQFPLFADTDLAVAEAFGVDYRTFKLFRRARRSCFLIDQTGEIRYRWIADHPIDPTRTTPDLENLRAAIDNELGAYEPETFGFDGQLS